MSIAGYIPSRREFLRMTALAAPAFAMASGLAMPRLFGQEPHPTASPINDLTDQDEIALGDIIAKSLEKEMVIVENPLIDAYLAGIVDRLSKVSQRPNLPYHCMLVNTDEINAASIAGGRIYLNRGLVSLVEREDQLVATLAHEIGHVVGHHSANQLMLTFKARKAYDLVKSHIPEHSKEIEAVIEKLGGAVAMLAMLHYSRANEYEADKLGFYEMLRAGYQPSGFLDLFQLIAEMEKQAGDAPVPFLRDHPPTADRAQAIRHEMTLVTIPKGADEDSISFHAFRLAMNLLPDPPKPKSDRQ